MAINYTAQDVIDRAGHLLQDVAGTRWPAATLYLWINDGQRQIMTLSPAATVQRVSHALVAGYMQDVPADCFSILDISQNTTGEPITRIDSLDLLSMNDTGWMQAAGNAVVDHVLFNAVEKRFITYPTQPQTAGSVELVYSAYPTNVTAGVDALSIEDEYLQALVNYTVYRAVAQDSDNTVNPNIAESRYAEFIGALPGASAG